MPVCRSAFIETGYVANLTPAPGFPNPNYPIILNSSPCSRKEIEPMHERMIMDPVVPDLITKVELFERLTRRMAALYAEKNERYGDSFAKSFKEWGEPMIAIRLEDKLSRFKTLIKNPELSELDESKVDTLIDLANYAVMGLIEMGAADVE